MPTKYKCNLAAQQQTMKTNARTHGNKREQTEENGNKQHQPIAKRMQKPSIEHNSQNINNKETAPRHKVHLCIVDAPSNALQDWIVTFRNVFIESLRPSHVLHPCAERNGETSEKSTRVQKNIRTAKKRSVPRSDRRPTEGFAITVHRCLILKKSCPMRDNE